MESEPAIVLLSGGLDSLTVLALARARGLQVHALSFRYGQRHEAELMCAGRAAQRHGAHAHRVVDLAHFSQLVAPATSLLAGSEEPVPKATDPTRSTIPSTYVPARNMIFLSYAVAWAEVVGAREIHIGVNAVDYSGYPDCRPEFVRAFEVMANLATRAGTVSICAPLQDLSKEQIIVLGLEHGVEYADTVSCYDPAVRGAAVLACGRCDSCQLRRRGFECAGVPDPTRYRDG